MKRGAIYGRISEPDQSEYSLDGQQHEALHQAELDGFSVAPEDIHIDNGKTGTILSRPEFNRLKAKAGKIDRVYILRQDRFSRADVLDTWNLFRELHDKGTEVYSLQRQSVIRVGDLLESLPMLLDAYAAQQEAIKIQTRARDARKERAKAGKVSMPFGRYGYDYHDGKLTLNTEETKVVLNIFRWYLGSDGERLGFTGIANRLTKDRTPTKRDKVGRAIKTKRGYGIWSKSAVADIIHDEIYTGVRYENGIPITVPAIIDRSIWEAAQLIAKRAKRSVSQSTKERSLMHGRITCARCNGTFAPERSRLNTYAYKCPGVRAVHSHDGQTRTCYGGFSMAEIDRLIWTTVADMLKNPQTIIANLREAQAEKEAKIAPDREYLERCQDERTKMIARRENATLLYIDGRHDKAWLDSQIDEFDRHIADLDAKIKKLTEALAEAEIDATAVTTIEQFCEEIRQGIDNATFEQKREVIRILDITAIVQRGEKVRPGRKCRATGMITLYGYFPEVTRNIGLDDCQLLGTGQHALVTSKTAIPFTLQITELAA